MSRRAKDVGDLSAYLAQQGARQGAPPIEGEASPTPDSNAAPEPPAETEHGS
jgi:hypothetical protein